MSVAPKKALGQHFLVDENILGLDAGATAAGLNLFVRNGDGWRMVLHHSSQIVVPPIVSGPFPGITGPRDSALVTTWMPLTYRRIVVPS